MSYGFLDNSGWVVEEAHSIACGSPLGAGEVHPWVLYMPVEPCNITSTLILIPELAPRGWEKEQNRRAAGPRSAQVVCRKGRVCCR